MDGQELPLESTYFTLDGKEVAFSEVSKENTFALAMNKNITIWADGVKLVCGSDSAWSYYKMGAFQDEVTAHVEAGMSPMEAIVCATSTSAECLEILDETGTLEPGKRADAIIVHGDPSEDITALHDVDTVVKAGQIVKRGGMMTL